MARCDMHDLDNCADCNGLTKAHAESLKDKTSWQVQQERGDVPFISGGTTIRARFGGNCVGCGTRYEPDEAIFSPHRESGWYAECCFTAWIGNN